MIRIIEDASAEDMFSQKGSKILTNQPLQDQADGPTSYKRVTPARSSSQTKINSRSATLKSRPGQDTTLNRGASMVLLKYDKDDSPEPGRNSVNKRLLPRLDAKTHNFDDEKKSTTGRAYSEIFLRVNMEAKRIAEENEKKKTANFEIESALSNKFLEENYEVIGGHSNPADDAENVKTLDRWRMEIKRKKILTSMNKMSEIMDTYKEKKAKENVNIPLVNAEALNRIMVESDDEDDEGKHSDEEGIYSRGRRAVDGREGAQKSVFSSAPEKVIKGVEASIAENNQDLLQAIINKKVKENIKNFDLENMTTTQIRLQIKAIADSAVAGFRALKGYISDTFVNNQVDMILKKLKTKKSEISTTDLFGFKVAPHETINNTNKGPVDYVMIESALVKNYEQANEDIENRLTQISQLNQENFKFKREMGGYQEQLQQLSRKSPGRGNSKVLVPIPTSDKNFKTEESSKDFDDSSNELIKNQKMKQEKKKQEATLREKISAVQQKLVPIGRDTENAERELKVARNTKAYFKLQLKDLYFKILKDEQYLMENKINTSYTWVIRALWKINEEVKEQFFPTFMDENAIKFALELANTQNELEKFCRQNNLFGMISHNDDFKRINVVTNTQAFTKIMPDNGDISSAHLLLKGARPKTINELLGEVKDRMLAMKKVNLRAKKMVNAVHFNIKGRQTVAKWEDVDPFLTNDELVNHAIYAPADSEGRQTPALSKLRTNKIESTVSNEADMLTETITKMLESLENMKKAELQRVIKENISLTLDQRLSLIIQKTFIFLFGNTGGNDFFRKFMKEKRVFDDRNMKSNQTHKKSQAQPRNAKSVTRMASGITNVEGDRFNNSKTFSRRNTQTLLPSLGKSSIENVPSMPLNSSVLPTELEFIQPNNAFTTRVLHKKASIASIKN